MRITARVRNQGDRHEVAVSTEGREQRVAISAKAAGRGSSVNGGELLCLALATCYCNDVFREAAARGLSVASVEVEVEAEFGGAGEPARALTYRTRIAGESDEATLRDLARQADAVAEVQNTLRGGIAVQLGDVSVVPRAGG